MPTRSAQISGFQEVQNQFVPIWDCWFISGFLSSWKWLLFKEVASGRRMFKTHCWHHLFLFRNSVSLGEFSDTSTDESLVRKKINDFHLSDDEEKNSPRLSFLKTKNVKSDICREEQELSQHSKGVSPEVHDDVAGNSSSKSQNDAQEGGKEINAVKPKPRVLSKRSPSPGNLGSYCNCVSETFVLR